jgi:hypothetical protein
MSLVNSQIIIFGKIKKASYSQRAKLLAGQLSGVMSLVTFMAAALINKETFLIERANNRLSEFIFLSYF